MCSNNYSKIIELIINSMDLFKYQRDELREQLNFLSECVLSRKEFYNLLRNYSIKSNKVPSSLFYIINYIETDYP